MCEVDSSSADGAGLFRRMGYECASVNVRSVSSVKARRGCMVKGRCDVIVCTMLCCVTIAACRCLLMHVAVCITWSLLRATQAVAHEIEERDAV